MSSTPPPPDGASVTSLVDRLPPVRRARQLATMSMSEHVIGQRHLARFTTMAEHLADYDADAALTVLTGLPRTPETLEALASVHAARGLKLYLENDHEGGFAAWQQGIDEMGPHAAPILSMRGLLHIVRDDLDAALTDLDRAVALSPTNAEAYTRRGDIHHKAGRHDEAMANYRRAAQLDPGRVGALTGMARSLLAGEEHEEAIGWYTRAIKLAPEEPNLRIERARCYEATERRAEALADLDIACAHAPDDPEIHYARARCRPLAESDEALTDLTRALDLDPEDVDIWLARARLHLRRKEIDAAQADVERALAVDPSDAPAHYTMGLVHYCRRDLRAALASYEAASRIAPTDERYIMGRAMIARRIGDPALVRGVLDAFIVIAPTQPQLRASHGRLLAREGKHERALDHFDAAVALSEGLPDDEVAAVHHDRSKTLHALGRLEEAIDDEERAVDLNPDVAEYHSWLGLLLSCSLTDADRAEAESTLAISMEPNEYTRYLYRGLHRERGAQWDAALADYDRAIDLNPADAHLYVRRALCRWHSPTLEDGERAAIADFDLALTKLGDHHDTLCWAAHARMELGEHEAALAQLDRAVAADPQSGEAFYLRSQCRRALKDEAGADADLRRSAELGWSEALEDLGQPEA